MFSIFSPSYTSAHCRKLSLNFNEGYSVSTTSNNKEQTTGEESCFNMDKKEKQDYELSSVS